MKLITHILPILIVLMATNTTGLSNPVCSECPEGIITEIFNHLIKDTDKTLPADEVSILKNLSKDQVDARTYLETKRMYYKDNTRMMFLLWNLAKRYPYDYVKQKELLRRIEKSYVRMT